MSIGNKIRAIRIRKALTQKDVADRMSCLVQQVSEWERSDNIQWASLERICKEGLGVEVSDLLKAEEV